MGKGKRKKRVARREWAKAYLNHLTDYGSCECGHNGMEAHWHSRSCPVHIAAWDRKPA